MSDDYSVGAGTMPPSDANVSPQGARGPVFRGMRRSRVNPQTGQRETQVWVQGRGYVPEQSRARLTSEEQQQLTAAEAAAQNYQQHLPDLNRFEELNRTVPTGAWFQRFGQAMPTGPAPRVFSWDANGPDTPGGGPGEFDEMRAITSRLTPDQREPGSGSSSNLDVGMFREGLPNVSRDGPANSRIIQQYRSAQRDAQDYADFLNWYWPQTGTLNNAQALFQQYRTARQQNPELSWQQYFGGGAAQGAPGAGQGGVERWTRDAQGNLVRQR